MVSDDKLFLFYQYSLCKHKNTSSILFSFYPVLRQFFQTAEESRYIFELLALSSFLLNWCSFSPSHPHKNKWVKLQIKNLDVLGLWWETDSLDKPQREHGPIKDLSDEANPWSHCVIVNPAELIPYADRVSVRQAMANPKSLKSNQLDFNLQVKMFPTWGVFLFQNSRAWGLFHASSCMSWRSHISAF